MVRTLGLLLAVGLWMVGTFANAATPPKDKPAETAPAVIGTIDMEAIYSTAYTGYRAATERFKVFVDARQTVLNDLQLGIGLNEKDFAEYAALAGHAVKVDAKRYKELQDQAKVNKAIFDQLKGKEKPTEEEKAKLTLLEKDVNAVAAKLDQKSASLGAEVETETERYNTILMGLVNKAIEDVAKAKKLSIVIAREFRTREGKQRLVYWGGTDISDDVITLLNKEFKETMLDPQADKPAAENKP